MAWLSVRIEKKKKPDVIAAGACAAHQLFAHRACAYRAPYRLVWTVRNISLRARSRGNASFAHKQSSHDAHLSLHSARIVCAARRARITRLGARPRACAHRSLCARDYRAHNNIIISRISCNILCAQDGGVVSFAAHIL